MAENLPDLVARLRLDMSQAQASVGRSAAIGGAIGSVLGIGITKAVGAAMSGLRKIVGGGLDRALNIEDAQAKLRGLGHDAQSVTTIMDSALDSVRGTAYGLDDAATQAASAVAAGIEPGQELTKHLQLTADAATIAGASMSEMGPIVNRVAAGGRAMTQELNMLQDRGLPIFSWLQEEYGVTADELRKMVSQGEVDSETFMRVLEDNIGGSALASGETVRGALANMGAALSRAGAGFFTPLLGHMQTGLTGLTSLIDSALGDTGARAGEALAGALDRAGPVISSAWQGLRGAFSGDGPLAGLTEQLSGVLPTIRDMLAPLGDMFAQLGPQIGAAIPDVLSIVSALSPLQLVIRSLLPVLPMLADLFTQLVGAILGAVGPLLPVLAEVAGMIGEALVSALTTLVPVVAEVAMALGGILVQALDAVAPVLSLLPEVLAAVLPAVLSLVPVILQLVTAILPLVPVIAQLIASLLPPLAQLILAVVPPVVQLVTQIAGLLVPALQLVAGIISTVVVPIVTLLANVLGAIVPPIVTVVGAILGGLVNALSTVIGWITGVVSAIVGFFTSLGELPGHLSAFVETISAGISAVLGFFAALPGRAFAAIAGLVGRVSAVARNAMSALGSSVVSGISRAVSTIAGLPGRAASAAAGLVGRLRSAGSNALSSMRSAISSGISNVLGVLRNLPSRAMSAIANLPRMFLNAGRNIMSSLGRGIRNAIGNVTGAVSNAVGRIRDFLPFSPAKVGPLSGRGHTLFAGHAIAGDLARGIQQRTDEARRAAERMAGAVAGVDVEPPGLARVRTAAARATPPAPGAPGRSGVQVRVFIGETELTDIVRTEVTGALEDEADAITIGSS